MHIPKPHRDPLLKASGPALWSARYMYDARLSVTPSICCARHGDMQSPTRRLACVQTQTGYKHRKQDVLRHATTSLSYTATVSLEHVAIVAPDLCRVSSWRSPQYPCMGADPDPRTEPEPEHVHRYATTSPSYTLTGSPIAPGPCRVSAVRSSQHHLQISDRGWAESGMCAWAFCARLHVVAVPDECCGGVGAVLD